MTDEATGEASPKPAEQPAPPAEVEATMSFATFLETIHPSVSRQVAGATVIGKYSSGNIYHTFLTPDLRLYCDKCGGERTFRSTSSGRLEGRFGSAFLQYTCGDCHEQLKRYSVLFIPNKEDLTLCSVYKYGEAPRFGIPVSNRVLRLFGKDAELVKKGRDCENQGLGIGAFAYYRRVVETHKNDIFDAIIRVCETLNAGPQIAEELEAAKKENSFKKSVESIKAGLPQGLLINGVNPLSALHSALSVGIHDQSDEECLAIAQAVRVVLTDLAEKIAMLKQDDQTLKSAVAVLLSQKEAGKAAG